MRLLIVTMLCAFIPLPALSAQTDCKANVKSQYPNAFIEDQDVCYCGSQLINLTVTLPSGLRVTAVCGLSFDDALGNHPIDLTREKLSLDTYRQGNYPSGNIYLSGVTQEPVTGTVRAEEGPGGDLSFSALRTNRRGPAFNESHLKALSLGSDLDYKKLRAPTPKETRGTCWEAEATIKIRNPHVTLGSTNQAGTWADFDVIRVAEYKPCPKRDNEEHPEARLTKGQPQDVAELIHRIIGCNYYQGDWPYAEEYEKEQYAAEIVKLSCAALPKDEEKVRASYLANEIVGQRINAAKSFKY